MVAGCRCGAVGPRAVSITSGTTPVTVTGTAIPTALRKSFGVAAYTNSVLATKKHKKLEMSRNSFELFVLFCGIKSCRCRESVY
jgi:hypothetical protein